MGDTTKIEWAHSTLNLWYGCTQISPACDHCYAMRTVHRLKLGVVWNRPPVKSPKDRFAQLRAWQRGASRFIDKHEERRRVFINSMSDFFDNQAPQEWRDEAYPEFEHATDVDILLVTKRPQNVMKMVPKHWTKPGGWPPHVWLIYTAENDEEAHRRGRWITAMKLDGWRPPVVGVSIEPMIERINPVMVRDADWLIVGGESGGPKARPFNPDWARELKQFARLNGQYFFFKQMRNKGDIPGDLLVREFPA